MEFNFDSFSPVKASTSNKFSISSPNKVILHATVSKWAGKISTISPLTLNVPLTKDISFLVYWSSVNCLNNFCLGNSCPSFKVTVILEYVSTDPIP